ncbi:MAG TPA: amino acid--tRNA ligase-related protein, partial [Acidobacteriaceae bacterium]|nr:amino acid--tRNA ligase-related protein [Acidobacteriaceae bacterium]
MSQFESQFEEDLYHARQQTLQKISELGQKSGLSAAEATYPNHFRFSPENIDIPAIRRQYDGLSGEQLEADKPPVAIAGRIVALRLQGKAGFAQLQQGGQRLQIYVRKDNVGEDGFELYKLLDLGDHIGVEGYVFRTRTNELTIHVEKLTFLTKAMLPLPDKFSGLGDIELRYRRRYLDLFTDTGDSESEPAAPYEELDPEDRDDIEPAQGSPFSTRVPAREVFVKRAAILRAIRKFFDDRGYLEVETPMLHTVAGGAAARPFTTHHNALDIPLSLRIAPELYLKRLVVGGLDRVYEINRNFRNEGVSTKHNPEFTMLEFYQAYANYHDLMDLTQELITTVAQEVNGTTITHFNGNEIDLGKWTKLSMREAVIKFWPEELGSAPTENELNDPEKLQAFLWRAVGTYGKPSTWDELTVWDPEDGSWENELEGIAGDLALCAETMRRFGEHGKVIAQLFEAVAETELIQPTIIYDFPLAVSPLSKIKPDEPDWVERFEFYIGGFEVGNAFSELNDPGDQRNRFLA